MCFAPTHPIARRVPHMARAAVTLDALLSLGRHFEKNGGLSDVHALPQQPRPGGAASPCPQAWRGDRAELFFARLLVAALLIAKRKKMPPSRSDVRPANPRRK